MPAPISAFPSPAWSCAAARHVTPSRELFERSFLATSHLPQPRAPVRGRLVLLDEAIEYSAGGNAPPARLSLGNVTAVAAMNDPAVRGSTLRKLVLMRRYSSTRQRNLPPRACCGLTQHEPGLAQGEGVPIVPFNTHAGVDALLLRRLHRRVPRAERRSAAGVGRRHLQAAARQRRCRERHLGRVRWACRPPAVVRGLGGGGVRGERRGGPAGEGIGQ